ncbi:MAG: cytidylate kinase-like family protein [Anaerovoracaceae bacterium]|nr:cytidylate kinase-like family protein [Bacillota bacterium]MDY2670080.1 cytidylate kinase-like family protein [Anaerovoracaceae bacterium]
MSIRIITISREFGSGGRSIAELVAKELGFAFYDKALIAKAAERTGFAESFIKEHGEQRGPNNLFSLPFASSTYNGMSTEDYLWSMQRSIILELADKAPCVIVGRCSDYILRNRKDAFHVFIHANHEDRAERVVNQYGVQTNNPLKTINEEDKKRRKNYRYYTDREWGAADNYNVSLDSSLFGIEGTADLIIQMARDLGVAEGEGPAADPEE